MKCNALIALVLVAAAPLHALAQNVTLDFEGAGSFASVANFYNGGTDTGIPGNSGSNYGISFGLDVLALPTDDTTLSISNAPSGSTVISAVGPEAFMNVASGFAGVLQFYYSSDISTTVSLFSGVNGSGSPLWSTTFAANATNGCTDSAFCHFDLAILPFAGTAKSVSFGQYVAVDNVNVTLVPEPSSFALALAGLGALGFVARRRRG